MKVFYNKKNRHSISAVHPKKYQERFYDFMLSNMTKPAYENFKTNTGYVETCEQFIESLIARLRIYELNMAGMNLHSCVMKSNQLPGIMSDSIRDDLIVEMIDDENQETLNDDSNPKSMKRRLSSKLSNATSAL